jgi:hypothetical protein
MAIKSLKKYVLDTAKDAKNYIKKKTKPKAKATSVTATKPKAKATSVTATKPKAKATSVTATKPKSTATSVTATKPKSTATSVTAKATKVQPRQLDFNKAKISSAAIAGTGAGAGYIAGRNSDKKAAPAATTKATTKAPIVTKKQLEDSGFTNLRDYMNDKKGLTRRDGKAPERRGDNNGGNIASRTDNSDGSKVGPNMSQVNKPDAKSAVEKDSRSTMQKLFGASEDKRAMGRNQMNAARKSMGFEKGGNVKGMGLIREDRDVYKKGAERDKPAVKRMLEEKPKRPPKAAAYKGMKHGGNVKKYKKGGSIDGCAVRGLTRAKHK